MKKLKVPKIILTMLLCAFAPISLWAQTQVSGIVIGSNKEPLIGATVMVKNTTVGVVTGMKGEYTINAAADATLVFSYIGMTSKEEPVAGRTKVNVSLSDNIMISDVVVVGYGKQEKKSLTGAVSNIKGADMVTTKSENPMNMLTGKLPGLRVWQKSAEPGTYSGTFDIRGMTNPLVIIDGIPRSVADFNRLNANDIAEVSVLKDGAAAIYGFRAGNGAVIVTTKKGKDGETSVSYNGSFTFQKPSGMPVLANAFDAMTLFNEKKMNNVDGGTLHYTEKDFEDYRNGTKRTTDWTGLLFSDFAPQTQHDLSISGGNAKTQYYVSMGYLYQEGFFKSGDLNYDKFNLRSNITTQIAKGLKFDLSLSGLADTRNTPYSSSTDIIRNYWKQGVLFPAYADPDNTMLNYAGLDDEDNTVAMMTADVSGYKKYQQKNFQSSASLSFDFGVITPVLEGLSAKGMANFDYRLDNNTSFRKEYSQYAYNAETDSYEQKLFNKSSKNNLRRENYDKQLLLGQVMLTYDRTFANVHKVGALVGWEVQKQTGDNFYAARDLAFGEPYLFAGVDEGTTAGMSTEFNDFYENALGALFGRINYAYDNRYLIEAQFRYDGSSKFSPGHQWGFFPSISAGWRLSEEPWFKSWTNSKIDQLKLRASYGILGDIADDGYDWMTGFKYPSTAGGADKGYYNGYAPGYIFGGSFNYAADPLAIPNASTTWLESKTFNVGVDFSAWNGLFGFAFDYFDRRRTGIFAQDKASIPTVVGAKAPRINGNSDRQFGMELELSHRNRIGEFSYDIKGIASITRRKHLIDVEKSAYGNSYDRWRNDNMTNRYQGVQFGYTGAGRYENWNDIWTYQIYKDRDVLPGDYKYEDWNGDGEINGLDEHPFAFDQTPWLNFSLSFGGEYKGFDLNFLFQGSALGSMEYKEPLYSIWGENGGGTLVQYLDRWRPTDPSADPYSTSTSWEKGYYGYMGHSPKGNSEFNRVSTSYLRLKSIEVGYTLPKLKKFSSASLRIYANAYNMFTMTGVKFVDPEHPDDDMGRMYPLSKTYSLGVSLTF